MMQLALKWTLYAVIWLLLIAGGAAVLSFWAILIYFSVIAPS
jgi:hypothetical protein